MTLREVVLVQNKQFMPMDVNQKLEIILNNQ